MEAKEAFLYKKTIEYFYKAGLSQGRKEQREDDLKVLEDFKREFRDASDINDIIAVRNKSAELFFSAGQDLIQEAINRIKG
jgi:hypothetical protein